MEVSNERDAAELILSIFPDLDDLRGAGVGQKCLTILADAITEANVYGRDKWAVRNKANPDRIQLLVNHIVVCTLGQGRIWMALDKGLLETSSYQSLLDQSDDWEWGEGGLDAEYQQIPSRNGFYMP